MTTYDAMEQSVFGGAPWEAYWFSCGASSWRYTAGKDERTLLGQVYTPEAITRTEIEQNQELSSGSIKVTVPIDSEVAQLFIGYLPPQPVYFVIYRGHEGITEDVDAATGMVAGVKFGAECELTIVPEQNALKRKIPGVTFQHQCVRSLYSIKCGVSRASRQVVATLTGVSGNTITSPTFAGFADGYFNAGWVEGEGTAMAILSHIGDTLTLFYPVAGLGIGDTVVGLPGCQGTETECATKFNNLVNHLGFARIPSVNPFGEGGIQ